MGDRNLVTPLGERKDEFFEGGPASEAEHRGEI